MSSNNEASPHKKVVLIITSYALKEAPLDFKPDVHLNARRLINPPIELRKAFDGRSETLRKNIRADPAFQKLIDEAMPQVFEAEKTIRALILDEEHHSTQIIEIKVAVGCVRGRHRSVAVAEELAQLTVWPEHYDQNLERERNGESVEVDETDSDEDQESDSTGESERRRSESEPTNSRWSDIHKSQSIKVDSKSSEAPHPPTHADSKDFQKSQEPPHVESKHSENPHASTHIDNKDPEIRKEPAHIDTKDSHIVDKDTDKSQTPTHSADKDTQKAAELTHVESKEPYKPQEPAHVENKDSVKPQEPAHVDAKEPDKPQESTHADSKEPDKPKDTAGSTAPQTSTS
ncbi:hypothetical protein D6D02_04382 [Aureobasidium pullulans]|nr:hypothetical protein D6D02_04382 [Aureobasidium pullulans]